MSSFACVASFKNSGSTIILSKAARIAFPALPAGQHATIAEFQDDGLAVRLLVQLGRQRTNACLQKKGWRFIEDE